MRTGHAQFHIGHKILGVKRNKWAHRYSKLWPVALCCNAPSAARANYKTMESSHNKRNDATEPWVPNRSKSTVTKEKQKWDQAQRSPNHCKTCRHRHVELSRDYRMRHENTLYRKKPTVCLGPCVVPSQLLFYQLFLF